MKTRNVGEAVTDTNPLPVKPISPIDGAVAVVQSDTADVAPGVQFAVICTGAGNVKVSFSDHSTFTFPVAVGLTIFPWAVVRVWSTGTTATGVSFANLF